MIVDNTEKDFSGGNDAFTLAGRLSLVGGGVYAINKTIDEASLYKNKVFHAHDDKLRKNLSGLISSASTSRPDPSIKQTFGSNFFNDIAGVESARWNYDLSRAKGLMRGGHKNLSGTLYQELEAFKSHFEQAGGTMSVGYKTHMIDGKQQVSYIRMMGKRDGKTFNFGINPTLSDGTVLMGSGETNRYVSKSVYKKTLNGIETYGPDVGLLRSYDENLDDVLEGRITTSELSSKYDTTRSYSDKTTRVGRNANPEIIDYNKTASIEDPGLTTRTGAMGGRGKDRFMAKQSKLGRTASSPNDYYKGVLLDQDAPVFQSKYAFLDETSNPKQLFRNIKHADLDGNVSYMANKKALFLGGEEMQSLRSVLEERGVSFGELAEDQLLVSRGSGLISDTQRSLSISSGGVSEHSEYILKKSAAAAGMSPSTFSSNVAKHGGLSGFSDEIQQKIRGISLDDYGRELKVELDAVRENQKRLRKGIRHFEKIGGHEVDIQSATEELLEYEERSKQIRERMRNQNYFGKKADLAQDMLLKESHKGLFLDDVHYSDGTINFGLRREKYLGAGDKIHNTSGELKAIIKTDVDDLEGALVEAYKRRGASAGELDAYREQIIGMDFIANKSALKETLSTRTAHDVFYNVFQRAYRENNQTLLHELNKFQSNYSTMAPEDRTGIFNKIRKITGQEAHIYADQALGFGTMKEHRVAFGSAAVDMGSGGLGSFSKRHVQNWQAIGMTNFAQDVVGRRINSDSVQALLGFEKTKRNMADKKLKGVLGLDDISVDKLFPMEKAFDHETLEQVLAERKGYLKNKGVSGTAIIDLGEEIEGIRRVPVFSDEMYRGFIAGQVGSKSDQRKYTELDRRVKSLLVELKSNKPRDARKLKDLVKNYNTAMEAMGGTLRNTALKGKVSKSMYGIVDTAPEGLEAYSRAINKAGGTKAGYASVAVIGDKEFRNMFGKDTYQEVMDQVKKFGQIGKGTDLSDLNKVVSSKSWAMMTRDPVEGINHLAMNVMPAGAFEGAGKIPGGISVVSGEGYGKEENKTFNKVMKMLFGDHDGDAAQLVAARNSKSREELAEYARGNSEKNIAIRENQRLKAEMSLKGKTQKSLLEMSLEDRRAAVAAAKELEKGKIGVISNTLEDVHRASRAAAISTDTAGFKKFASLATSLQFFAENSIKGKHQSMKELQEGKVMKVLESLSEGGGDNTARKATMMGFFDDLALSQYDTIKEIDRNTIANQLRSASIDGDELRKIEGLTLDESKKLIRSGWFKNIASDDNINTMMDFFDQSKKMGASADDAIELAVDNLMDGVHKHQKIPFEKLTDMVETNKKVAFRGFKNIGKYALLPAAGIGLIGTMMGGSGSISDGKDFSDGQKRHTQSGQHRQRPVLPQMRSPKYERVQMRGTSQGQINYESLSNSARSNVHIQDDGKLLDRYEIQDIIDRGI